MTMICRAAEYCSAPVCGHLEEHPQNVGCLSPCLMAGGVEGMMCKEANVLTDDDYPVCGALPDAHGGLHLQREEEK